LVRQIKAKSSASNANMFASSASGVGTALLAVLVFHLFGAGALAAKYIWAIGAGIAAPQTAKAVFYAIGLW
jgi:hypothetical protein